MLQKIKIISLPKDDEYEVVVDINGNQIKAMIGFCNQDIEEGQDYLVEFTFDMFDGFDLQLTEEEKQEVIHQGNYSYRLIGKLVREDTIDVGFPISSDWLEDYSYLVGQTVTCSVDRLEINFG